MLWPSTPAAAFALVGVVAFLAAAMRAPLTALILVLEFTGEGPAMLILMTLAVAGGMVVENLLGRRRVIGID